MEGEDTTKVIFGSDVNEDTWKEILIKKYFGDQDLEYDEEDNGYVKWEIYRNEKGYELWFNDRLKEFSYGWSGNDSDHGYLSRD